MAGVGSIGATTPFPVAYRSASTSGKTPSAVSGGRPAEVDTSRPTPGASREGTQSARGAAARELTEEEQQQVDQLKQRDREVRSHEQAHSAAAGRYANGGAQFEFTTGPDGRQYATGGHVNIDVGPANTPEATLIKAQVIRRAALAPADPSGQDRSVASAATQLERDARKQIQDAREAEAEAEGGAEGVVPRRALAQYSERGGGAGAAKLDLQA